MTVAFVPGERVEVPEILFKELVRLPAGRTAVIVVDMQNDFVKPGQMDAQFLQCLPFSA